MRRRLFALLIAPLLALGVLGVQLTNQAASKRAAAEDAAQLVTVASEVAALDQALGAETLVAISANEQMPVVETGALAVAESNTDQALTNLEAVLAPLGDTATTGLLDSMDAIRVATSYRADLVNGLVTPLQLVDRYGALRGSLVDAVVVFTTTQNTTARTTELLGLVSLIQARSAHLDERLAVDLALRYETWAPGQQTRIVRSIALQRERLSMASRLIGSTGAQESATLAEVRSEIASGSSEIPTMERSTWAAVSAGWLNQLDEQVLQAEQRLAEQVAADTGDAKSAQRVTIAALGLTLIVAMAIAAIISVRLIRRVRRIAKAVGELSLESTPIAKLDDEGSDEISEMAAAFNRMSDRIRHSSSVRQIESQVLGSIAAGEPLATTIAQCSDLLPATSDLVVRDGVVNLVDPDGRRLTLDEAIGEQVFEDDQLAIGLAQLAQWRSANLAALRKRATFDALTGALNRASSMQALADLCETGRPAVLFIDLDNFKRLNDAHGHERGDEALRNVAEVLTASTAHFGGIVGRLGGDEFIIVVPDERDHDWLTSFATELLSRIASLRGFASTGIGVSIGIAPNDGGQTPEELLQESDAAMYAAKVGGRGRVVLADATLRRELDSMKEIEMGLDAALSNDEITVAYQGIWNDDGQRLLALEALARWTDGSGKSHSPGQFFTVAERLGYASDLDRHVLALVADQIARSSDAGLDLPPVHVNMSGESLNEPDVVESVLSTLNAARCPTHAVVIEITESAFISEIEAASDRLDRLRAAGIRIAVDDFGEGYSSLRYLSKLPIDVLKIDRQFIDKIDTSPNNVAIVRAIAGLASSLGMTVVAEGIERVEELHKVAELGCSQMQGFYFDRPKPSAEVAAFVIEHQLAVTDLLPPSSPLGLGAQRT